MVGQQRSHQRGVVGARLQLASVDVELVELDGHLGDQLLQLTGVGQVAVVAQRDGSVGGRPEGRLRVVPGAGTGRGVARVTDREVPLERRERGLVEDLRDQAHVLVDEDLVAVADRDAGRLLAAVLQRVEAVVGELRDLLARRPHAEDATGVLGCAVMGVEVVCQASVPATSCPWISWAGRAGVVWAGHAAECTCREGLVPAPPGRVSVRRRCAPSEPDARPRPLVKRVTLGITERALTEMREAGVQIAQSSASVEVTRATGGRATSKASGQTRPSERTADDAHAVGPHPPRWLRSERSERLETTKRFGRGGCCPPWSPCCSLAPLSELAVASLDRCGCCPREASFWMSTFRSCC